MDEYSWSTKVWNSQLSAWLPITKSPLLKIMLFLYKSSKSLYDSDLKGLYHPDWSIFTKSPSVLNVLGGNGPTISQPKAAIWSSLYPSKLIMCSPAVKFTF